MGKTIKLNKRGIWFKKFTDHSNKKTFLNKSASARAAGYNGKTDDVFRSIGYQNFTKLHERIKVWMDEVGLSENTLTLKHINLLEAEETKLIKIKGAVTPGDLPPNCQLITTTGLTIEGDDGDFYSAGESIIAINMQALGIQAKALDMGLKRRGMYAPEKREHTGTIEVKNEMNFKGLKDAIERDQET